MLKVNQLSTFNEVMLTGSISEAARNLHRTQSSISATIANFEDVLDMKLFERKNGRLHPVPEAYYLQNECFEILRRIETVSENMHRMNSLQTGELHIASMPGPTVFFLPNLISEFGITYPNIRSNVVSQSSVGVYRLMSGQQYDMGLVDYIPAMSEEASLIDTEVFNFRCLCAIPKSHSLATKDLVTPEDLFDEPLATLTQDHEIYSEVVGIFNQHTLKPNIRYMTQYFFSLLHYVEKGLACAIVDPISIENYKNFKEGRSHLVFRQIEPAVTFRVAVLTPKHRPSSLVAKNFGSHLKNSLSLLCE